MKPTPPGGERMRFLYLQSGECIFTRLAISETFSRAKPTEGRRPALGFPGRGKTLERRDLQNWECQSEGATSISRTVKKKR